MMAETELLVRLCNKSDTKINWETNNPILSCGEIGYDIDSKQIKIGDGESNWNNLEYMPLSSALASLDENKADKTEIPSKVSELSNDSNYATESFVTVKVAENDLRVSDDDAGTVTFESGAPTGTVIADVVQTTGQSEISVMSQKAVSDEIELLNSDLDEHNIEFKCVKNIFDKTKAIDGMRFNGTSSQSASGYSIFSVNVKKGITYNSTEKIGRSAFSFFEKKDGTRVILNSLDGVVTTESTYIHLLGYTPIEDGILRITGSELSSSEMQNGMIVNGDLPSSYYTFGETIKAETNGEKMFFGEISTEDIDFIHICSNLIDDNKWLDDSYYTKKSITNRTGVGYKTIAIPVKKNHHYSSTPYINKDFSFYNNGYLSINRTILTDYTESIYWGSTSILIGLNNFAPVEDGILCITINNDYYNKLSIIESECPPLFKSDYEKGYEVYIGDSPVRLHRTLTVGKDGISNFAQIKDALEYVNSLPYIEFTVYVGNGTYDLIEEFGDEYFSNLGVESRAGLKLDNNVHLIFSSNAKVICHYTGDNVNVKKNFSPFNTNVTKQQTGFILENLNLECSNVRYAIHDETSGQTNPYRNIYKNCFIKLDNSNNSYGYSQCIGGGLGTAGEIVIENCYFESAHSDSSEAIVSYHNGGGGGINRIVITGCYFANKDTCRCSHLGTGTNISTMIVSNCSLGAEPFTIYEQSGAYENMNLIKWNNDIRTN